MRTVWKGTIGFGDSAIPVKAYSATRESGTGLTQVHTTDGGRIRYKRVCEVDDAEIPAAEIGKGHATPGGEVVVLTDEDLAAVAGSAARSIQIHGFVPPAHIDPLYYVKSYYLEPDSTAIKPYLLLGEALRQADRVAVVTVAIRQRETLGALRVRDEIIILDTLHWAGAIRRPDFPFVHEDVDLRMAEVRAAANMIENLTGDFEPERYTDRYSDALAALVEARVEGGEAARPSAPVQDEGVARLLRALQESTQRRTDTDQESALRETSRQGAVRKAASAASKAGEADQAAKAAAARRRTPSRATRT